MCKIKDTIIEKQDTGIDTYGKKTVEPKNKWGYPSKVCAICKGRGVVYVSDGQDDVVGEICDCQK